MIPSKSASSDLTLSVQEQVASVLEELQILGSLDKLVAASEVSRARKMLTTRVLHHCSNSAIIHIIVRAVERYLRGVIYGDVRCFFSCLFLRR